MVLFTWRALRPLAHKATKKATQKGSSGILKRRSGFALQQDEVGGAAHDLKGEVQ
jgi:hypothetical protein